MKKPNKPWMATPTSPLVFDAPTQFQPQPRVQRWLSLVGLPSLKRSVKIMDTIAIAKLHRLGGPTWRERHSVDFIINGESLYAMTGAKSRDLCGRFSSDLPDWNPISSKAFVLESDPDDELLDDGQFLMFVCPECADLKCGAIICTIQETAKGFRWSNFAYDNGYEDGMPDYQSYAHIGPFHFPDSEYRQAIAQATNTEQDAALKGQE